MAATIRCATLITVLVFSFACSDSKLPPAPTSLWPSVRPYEPLRPLTGPSTTYVFSGPLLRPVTEWTAGTSYVVYENGAFVLSYGDGPPMVGTYKRENEHLLFDFDGLRTATGTLRGELLEVRYGELMQHSDFEDGMYKRSL